MTPEHILENLPESIPYDESFSALADSDRRRLLVVLRQLETPERVTALTRWLASEMGRSGEDEVERLHVSLHHVHVPKLVDLGIVSYDDAEGTVELTDRGRPLADALVD